MSSPNRHPAIPRLAGPPAYGLLAPLSAIADPGVGVGGLTAHLLPELRLPLTAAQAIVEGLMVEGGGVADLPAAAQLSLAALREQHDYVLGLIGEVESFTSLARDAIQPEAVCVDVRRWIDGWHAAGDAVPAGSEAGTKLRFRSLLPSEVVFDGELAARAIHHALRVALRRGLPGSIELSVGFEPPRLPTSGARLVVEIRTRGGGFAEVEQGFVFRPFAVRDVLARPLLGLSLAHRFCDLLDGGLFVESPGSSSCTYRLSFGVSVPAPAVWYDPMLPEKSLGPVTGGGVLYVGTDLEQVRQWSSALEGAGYGIEAEASVERLLARVANDVLRWSAVVIDLPGDAATVVECAAAVRQLGYRGMVVSIGGEPGSAAPLLDADADAVVDAVLVRGEPAKALLGVLRGGKRYSDSRNATSAR
jgi:hypothetical protein